MDDQAVSAVDIWLRGPPEEVRQNGVECFKHSHAMQCACFKSGYPFSGCSVNAERILEQVTKGGATCPACRVRVDLHAGIWFTAFGNLEALFGLVPRSFNYEIEPSVEARIVNIDARDPDHLDWYMLYANVSPAGHDGMEFEETPWLLAPQAMHQRWSPFMRFCIPAGSKRSVGVSFVLRPPTFPHAIELAVQACESFHRFALGTSCVLLAASIEYSLREALRPAYDRRGVAFPERVGMSELLDRARLLLDPPPGDQLVGSVRALAKQGRNPAAHGHAGAELTYDQVASWMVDVALIYEWARLAMPLAGAMVGDE